MLSQRGFVTSVNMAASALKLSQKLTARAPAACASNHHLHAHPAAPRPLWLSSYAGSAASVGSGSQRGSIWFAYRHFNGVVGASQKFYMGPMHKAIQEEYNSSDNSLDEAQLVTLKDGSKMLSRSLHEGRALLWTMGSSCSKTGKQTALAKELLEKHGIQYKEMVISDVS